MNVQFLFSFTHLLIGFYLIYGFFVKRYTSCADPIHLCCPTVYNSSFIIIVAVCALQRITMVTTCLLITFISKDFLPVLLPLRWKLIRRNKTHAPHKSLKLHYNSSWVNELVMSADSSEELRGNITSVLESVWIQFVCSV